MLNKNVIFICPASYVSVQNISDPRTNTVGDSWSNVYSAVNCWLLAREVELIEVKDRWAETGRLTVL